MTNGHVFEVINKNTGSPVATFLLREDATDFVGMKNSFVRTDLYRINSIHLTDRPFPATLVR